MKSIEFFQSDWAKSKLGRFRLCNCSCLFLITKDSFSTKARFIFHLKCPAFRVKWWSAYNIRTVRQILKHECKVKSSSQTPQYWSSACGFSTKAPPEFKQVRNFVGADNIQSHVNDIMLCRDPSQCCFSRGTTLRPIPSDKRLDIIPQLAAWLADISGRRSCNWLSKNKVREPLPLSIVDWLNCAWRDEHTPH